MRCKCLDIQGFTRWVAGDGRIHEVELMWQPAIKSGRLSHSKSQCISSCWKNKVSTVFIIFNYFDCLLIIIIICTLLMGDLRVKFNFAVWLQLPGKSRDHNARTHNHTVAHLCLKLLPTLSELTIIDIQWAKYFQRISGLYLLLHQIMWQQRATLKQAALLMF